MAATTRLTALDATFIEIESPTTPMHVGTITRFEGAPLRDDAGCIRIDDIRRHVVRRLEPFPRFRQRLVRLPFGVGRPVWADDPTFDVTHHVRLAAVPSPGGSEQLHRLAEMLHMQLLDRTRPLWELWFVDGMADGSVALIEKIHHSLVDGVSTVDFTGALLDLSPGPASEPSLVVPHPDAGGDDGVPVWWVATQGELGRPARALRDVASAAVRPRRTLAVLREALAGLSTVVLAPPSPINQSVGRHRRFEEVHLSLADVNAARARTGGTVNDVVLAAVAGGLRHLIESRGEAIGERPLRAFVPVSLRADADHLTFGNQVAGMLAPLPVHLSDPLDRLRSVREATTQLKGGGQARMLAQLLSGADLLPEALIGLVGRSVHRQPFANVVVTNVPAWPEPLYFLGSRMLDTVAIVPLGGNLAVSIGVVSYDSQLTLGLFADRDACPDVAILAEGIEKSFVELRSAAEGVPAPIFGTIDPVPPPSQ